MARLLLVLTTFLILEARAINTERWHKKGAELRLYEYLMMAYDTGSRPVMNANHTVQVNFSISLNKIHDLLEKNQTLITHVWVFEEWYDERLVWSPKKFGNLDKYFLPSVRIWLPDIYIFNNADKGSEGFVASVDSKLLVHHDGKIKWTIPLIIQSTCSVDITYFPFDNQHCFVRFGSWIYEEDQLDLLLKDPEVDLSPPFSANSELHLRKASLTRAVVMYGSHPGRYPQITMFLSLRRKPMFYAYTVIAPTLVLCILTLFSFLLPCDNGDKVGIGLTVFLSLYVLQLGIAETIPESNSLPLIGLFLTLVMTLNAISLVFATLVINIKKKGDRPFCRGVPRVVLKFCRRFLSVMTCTPFINFYEFYGVCDPHYMVDPPTPSTPSEALSTSRRPSAQKIRPYESYAVTTRNKESSAGMASLRPKSKDKDGNIKGSTVLKQRNISHLDILRAKAKAAEDKAAAKLAKPRMFLQPPRDPRYEWFFIAEVLDKSLFLIFLLGMFVTIIVSLVVVPYLHRND